MSLQVLKPGLLSTIQDRGRIGYQKWGVVVGGAMDLYAHRSANMLLGNNEYSPSLEITMSGSVFKWQKNTWISICGGDLSPEINDERVPQWRPIFVKKNSILSFKKTTQGCRSYIAVRDGFNMEPVMNSFSTYTRGAFGGYEGRPLRQGDVLEYDECQYEESFIPSWYMNKLLFYNEESPVVIRCIVGQEYDLFTEASQQELFSAELKLSPDSDRMGYRLRGIPFQLKKPFEMISEAVTMGTIQVPPNGEPILLMADRQTTGGYPRIAQIAAVDLSILAQLKPGDSFRLVEISHEQTEQLYLQREQDMTSIKTGIRLKLNH